MSPSFEDLQVTLKTAEQVLLKVLPRIYIDDDASACWKSLEEIKAALDAIPNNLSSTHLTSQSAQLDANFVARVLPAIRNAADFLDDLLVEISVLSAKEREKFMRAHSVLNMFGGEHTPNITRDTLINCVKDAYQFVGEWWVHSGKPQGDEALRAKQEARNLRAILVFDQYGIGLINGNLPGRHAPHYEICRINGNHPDSAYRTRAHAKNVLDAMDEPKPLSYFLLNTITGERHISFAARTVLLKKGMSNGIIFPKSR